MRCNVVDPIEIGNLRNYILKPVHTYVQKSTLPKRRRSTSDAARLSASVGARAATSSLRESGVKAMFIHRCTHVLDKQATIAFYKEPLGLRVDREFGPADGSWTNTFMVDESTGFELELTCNDERAEPYESSGPDSHIAFRVDDFGTFHALHEQMGCLVRESLRMGPYFIVDPKG